MSGKLQHEIPRLYQRGFLIPGTGNAERIYVFKRDKSYPTEIGGAGAENYFYSKLSVDGSRTLDDEVTDYETRQLTPLVETLRATAIGAPVDGRVVGEVIAHLTTRNAHLRGSLVHGFRTLAKGAIDVFGNEENVRHLAGLDTPWVSDRFREEMLGRILQNPQIAALGIPITLFEKMVYAAVREEFSPLLGDQLAGFMDTLKMMTGDAHETVREIHNSILAKDIVPVGRADGLASLCWRKIETDTDLVLPDCVALAIDAEGAAHPLMMADPAKIELVLLPLTSRTLLIASGERSTIFDHSGFNEAAASCSHTYFLARAQTPEHLALAQSIGTRSVLVVETAIDDALSEYSHMPGPDQGPALAELTPPSSQSVAVSYIGHFDQPFVDSLQPMLGALIGALAWTVPLDRLDGITFADDYPAALVALDRGLPGIAAPTTRQGETGVGIGQCPTIIRQGVVKGHVVVIGNVARALVSEVEEERLWGAAVLADLIAQAGVLQIVDESLPGVLLNHRTNGLVSALQRCTFPAWNSYFSSRASAGFDEARLAQAQEILLAVLTDAFLEIPKARLEYRVHGDLEKLLDATYPRIAFLLECVANVLGIADGTDRDPLEGAADLKDLLTQHQLLAWFSDFRRDLIFLWDRRRRWESYDEFLALNRHAERLLWCFTIIPWGEAPDGGYRVEVPVAIDLAALAALEEVQST